jgi:hypothetical protein
VAQQGCRALPDLRIALAQWPNAIRCDEYASRRFPPTGPDGPPLASGPLLRGCVSPRIAEGLPVAARALGAQLRRRSVLLIKV